MPQTLIITEEFFNSLSYESNAAILLKKGISSPKMFLDKIIEKLNSEFEFLKITKYAFPQTKGEKAGLYKYGGLVVGDNLQHNKIVVFFTPIESKSGDVIIEQSLMPTIYLQMQKNVNFLVDDKIMKIALLTSQINANNALPAAYNKMQLDVNSLNTLNIDVVPVFPIKNLSTDTKFNSLDEYIEMSNFLQQKNQHNAQNKKLTIENGTLFGDCDKAEIKGQFQKSFCFRFLTAVLSGGNDYKYDISKVMAKIDGKDRQFENLKKFVDYANTALIRPTHFASSAADDIIESDDDMTDMGDIHRAPEKGVDNAGRKRYKTQRKIRDAVIQDASYLCNCNDLKHFYFEAGDLHNYVEGHHIIPMNRQEEYYFSKNINLDIQQNIIALCPNCHSQIHLGSRQARLKILSELYVRNKARLVAFDKDLTLGLLAAFYNIGLEGEEEKDWLKRATKIVADKTGKIV